MIMIMCITCAFAALICYITVYMGAKTEINRHKYWEEHKNEFHGYNEFERNKNK